MEYFHGTIIKGLSELKPNASPFSNLKEPVVYLTTSRQLALHYIWDEKRIGVKMPMLDIRKDGTLVFQEMFSGALEYFYKGISGYIYRCIGDYEINSDVGVNTCAISRTAVPVTDFEYIEDVYESIVSYGDKGTFIYEKYEDLPQWRIDIIRGNIIRFIKRNNMINDIAHPSCRFIQEKSLNTGRKQALYMIMGYYDFGTCLSYKWRKIRSSLLVILATENQQASFFALQETAL